jgi:hypothetical protein
MRNTHALREIRTHDLSDQGLLRLRPRGHWDRLMDIMLLWKINV